MFGSARRVLVACTALALVPGVATADPAADRAGDLAAFVHGGLAAAPNNFSSVRGSRMDTSKFAALVNFGPTFVQCTVDDDTAAAMEDGAISAWSLDCDSQPILMPAADLLAQLKDEPVRQRPIVVCDDDVPRRERRPPPTLEGAQRSRA